ncbi:hypothetical protein Q6A83_08445 [Aliarcobacter skirrowii]|nr:hypothetical protein [Aliarcobacter skirrowii]
MNIITAQKNKKSYRQKGYNVFCKQSKLKYTFIKEYEIQYTIRRMCTVLKVHPSGYYKWMAS